MNIKHVLAGVVALVAITAVVWGAGVSKPSAAPVRAEEYPGGIKTDSIKPLTGSAVAVTGNLSATGSVTAATVVSGHLTLNGTNYTLSVVTVIASGATNQVLKLTP